MVPCCIVLAKIIETSPGGFSCGYRCQRPEASCSLREIVCPDCAMGCIERYVGISGDATSLNLVMAWGLVLSALSYTSVERGDTQPGLVLYQIGISQSGSKPRNVYHHLSIDYVWK